MSILNLKYPEANFLENLRNRFDEEFPGVVVGKIQYWGNARYYHHYYIQFTPANFLPGIHFEYYVQNRVGRLEFHLEPDPNNDEQCRLYRDMGISLMHGLLDQGVEWNPQLESFWLKDCRIDSLDSLLKSYQELSCLVEPLLAKSLMANREIKLELLSYPKQETGHVALIERGEDVSVRIMNLAEVMKLDLALPDYQRDYCWEDRNITDLWNSLLKIEPDNPFHLGTVILHDNQQHYDIIDGQQRLITLTLILLALGYDDYLPLLNESYESAEAQDHIANCKYVVKILVQSCKNREALLDKIARQVSFAVLVVSEANLDLAYTFFSNQNSKGVPLTDFDLLKAHHLRFIADEKQAEHVAVKWNKILQLPPVYHDSNALFRTIGIHIYRLRRWMRKRGSAENSYRYIQHEYQAAPSMPDIPPFGERLDFYEKIQGGTHFFMYVETFIQRYEDFVREPFVQEVRDRLSYGPYEIFADTLATLLFGYYLKFGRSYLVEAFFCFSQMMALYRYNSDRVATNGSGVRDWAMNSEFLLMIDQASSPTFFLAEALAASENKFQINSGLYLPETKGVKWGMYVALRNIWNYALPLVSDTTIRNKIIEEYGIQ